MATSRRSRTLLLAALAVLGVTALVLRQPRVPVEAAAAARGRLLVTIDEEGETRVRDRYVITAPVAGRLQRITLDEGDPVEQGTVVAQMNPLPLDPRIHAEATARLEAAEAAKREADARVDEARAALAQAERGARRARALGREGIVATETIERAELDEVSRSKQLDAALFAARAAEYNVAAARATLLAPGQTSTLTVCAEEKEACVALRAPATGRVLRVLQESERVVEFGTPLLEIGDPSKLEIVVDVLSSDAVKVAPGAHVLIHDWGGERDLEARVRLVEPSGFTKVSALGVEEQRVNVVADFTDPPAALGDGYRLEARIVVLAGQVLKIPSSALFRHQGRWSVFVVEGGRARRRQVEVGHVNSFEVEVAGGIDEGDVVIKHPSDAVDDGTRVHVT